MSKTYEITGPDGKKYRVTAPDGATQYDIMARVRAQATPQREPEPEPEVEGPVDFDTLTMLKNVPESAYQYGKDVTNAVVNPVETGKAVGGLFRSLAAKVGKYGYGRPMPEGSEDAANAVGQFYKDRYGGVDNIKRTLMNDPVGAVADASFVGYQTRIPGVARVAAAAEPLNVLNNTLKAGAKAVIPKVLPEALYRNANKLDFPATMSAADRSAALQAGMTEGIRATPKGAARLEGKTQPLRDEASRLIDEATAAGRMVEADGIFKYLDELRKGKGGVKVEGQKDLAKIDKIEQAIRDQIGDRWEITPREMQDFKTDAYQKIYDTSSGRKKKQTTADTYSAVARGAKETLEEALPEVGAINQKLSPLLNLARPVKKAADKRPSHVGNVLRATAPAVAGWAANATLGPVAGLVTAGATHLATSPLSKTKLAIAMNKIKRGEVGWLENNLTASEIRTALVLAGREEEQENEN